MKTENLTFDDFTEAFLIFITRNCAAWHEGGGRIGERNDPYCHSEIKITLNTNGSGYVHLLGQDSETMNFRTMDHFRSQDMITPAQRAKISEMTAAKATKVTREENKKLKQQLAEVNDQLQKLKQILNS